MSKKYFLLIALLILLSGCSIKETPKVPKHNYTDGHYYITYTHVDDLGWAPYLDLVIKNQVITQATLDCVNAQGQKKSEAQYYADQMKAITGTTPKAAFDLLETQLIQKQNIALIDSVSGATHTSQWFKEMITYALDHPEQPASVLPMNETYTATSETYNAHGWKGSIKITYEEDQMVTVIYDEYNKEGISKKDDADYKSAMSEVSETYPAKYTKTLENQLLEVQSADAIDIISGATYSCEYFIELSDKALSKRKPNPLAHKDQPSD